MLIFIAIAIGSFILIAGSFLFGHDHDADHHVDIGHAGEGHDFGHDVEPTISFFSIKVLATLTMGFGAAGAIARQYGADYLVASLWGLGSGIVLALLMYLVLDVIYKQQSSSLVETASAIGQLGTVTVSIDADAVGEVGVEVAGRYMTYLAKSSTSKPIPKGATVKVVQAVGSELIVEQMGK